MEKEDLQMGEAEIQFHQGLDSSVEASEDGVSGVKEASKDEVPGVNKASEDEVPGVKKALDDEVPGIKEASIDAVPGVKDDSESGVADAKEASQDGTPDGEKFKDAQPQEFYSSPPAVTDDNKKSHDIDNQDGRTSANDTVAEEQSNAAVAPQDQSHLESHKEKEGGFETEVGDHTEVDQRIQPEEEINGIEEEKQENRSKYEEKEDDLPACETETKGESVVSAVIEQSFAQSEKQLEGVRDTVMAEETIPQIAVEEAKNHSHDGELPFQLPVSEVPPKKKEVLDEIHQTEGVKIVKGLGQEVHLSETGDLVKKEFDNKSVLLGAGSHHDKTPDQVTKPEVGDSSFGNKHLPSSPDFPLRYSSRRSTVYSGSGEAIKNVINDSKMNDNDDGTPEQQVEFLKELEGFYRERGVEFKQPKFYGQLLNLYKLWTSVVKLGGYDLVTGTKLWRQIGESFHPPKTCTTVSWTFRIFYEKSLLEYERYKVQNGDIELPSASLAEPLGAENEANGYQVPGPGRARRDAAARAMQGWHSQKHYGYGEEKSPNSMQKHENKVKSIGSLKQKRPNEPELPVKLQRTETSKQMVPTVVDVGPAADYVKINIRETKDCFEIYALVPGLLREEVRVQSDPAGRVVITGQPEQIDNPWGITPFKKVITLPAKIDPLHTSAVVSLHGRLFVRAPFEQSS